MAKARKALEKHGQPLLVAPYISTPLGHRLVKAGWSWADSVGNWDLRAPGLLLQRRIANAPTKTLSTGFPRGSGSLAIIRWLVHLAPGSATATELGNRAGVSRPRASQVLATLVVLGLAEQTSRAGWRAVKDKLIDRFIDDYRGPGGVDRYFYSLRSPSETGWKLCAKLKPGSRVWISGDVAADYLAPHRRPSYLVVYSLDPRVVLPKEWVEAAGPGDANIRITYPRDESIGTRPMSVESNGIQLRMADPMQVLWDLHRQGGDDRMEAAEVMRKWLLKSPSVN